jgi:RHS repeat-associated protein
VSYQYQFWALDIVTTSATSGDAHYTASTVHSYYTTSGTPPLPYEVTIDPAGYSTTDFTDNVGNVIEQADNYGNTYTAYNSFDEPCWVAPPGVTVPNPSDPLCASPPATGTGSTFYTYDTYGNQTEVIDPMGNATYSGYNSYGELCWQTIPGTTISGPTCASPPSASTRYNYNAGAELLAETTPDGLGSSFTYDTTTYTYNAYGEVLTEVTPDGNVAGGTPANYTTTNYYDNAGRLYKTVAPMSRTTTATLDAVGNVTALTDPMGDVTSAAYDADNRQCWSYQGSASSVCGSPPSGSTRYSYYVNTADPLTVTDPDNHPTTYTYADPRVPNDPTTVTDALNNVTSNVYDKDGNLCVTGTTSVSLYATSDPNCVWPVTGGYTYDTFDQLGNVLSTEDPSGNSTSYARINWSFPSDVTKVTPPSGGGQAASTYTYDLDGRLSTETEGNGDVVTTTYTPSGQKCWQAPVSSGTCGTIPTAVGTSGWSYYNSQLPFEMVDITPSGTKYTAWEYDAQGQETVDSNGNGLVGYSYDYAGDNTCVAYPVHSGANCSNPANSTNTVVKYGYNNDGQMTSMADWLGTSFAFGYDARSNLTSITYPSSTTWSEDFGPYDAANNLSTLTLTSTAYGTYPASYPPNADEQYASEPSMALGYNAQSRVTTGGTHTFGYNPNGEVASDSPSGGTASSFTYNPDDELTKITAGSANESYAYDASGNQCAIVAGTSTPSCSAPSAATITAGWSAYGQLCFVSSGTATGSCSTPPTGVNTYFYDGDGLRTSDKIGSTTQNFLYNTQTRPGQPLIIEDGANAYLYGPGNFGAGTAPLEEISLSSGTASYLISNPVGVADLWNTSGDVIGSSTYSTYGVRTTANTTTPFGYQGTYTDASSDGLNLNYMIDRYYDPATDQFLSVDPLVMDTGQPYAFTGDDPLNGTDPLGNVFGPGAFNFSPSQSVSAKPGPPTGGLGVSVQCQGSGAPTQAQIEGCSDYVITGKPYAPTESPGAQVGNLFTSMLSIFGLAGGGIGAAADDGGAAAGDFNQIERAVSSLSAGRSAGVYTVSNSAELQELFDELSVGGSRIENAYPGQLVELPDGTTVGLRESSGSGGPAIDVNAPNGAQLKVHVDS